MMKGRIIAQQQMRKRNLNTRTEPMNNVRFIIVGASIMKETFINTSIIVDALEFMYPQRRGTTIYNHAINGNTSTQTKNNIDNILSNYTILPFTNTYVIVHTGGNDVTNTHPYSSATNGQKETLENNLIYIIDAIESKGFVPILNDLTFRDYSNITRNDESLGSLPYNENIIQPLILSRTPEFAFGDGQSFWQLYTLLYNDYETYLSADNVHLTTTGYDAIRTAFVNTICKYIFTGVPPTKIEKE